MYAFVRAGMAWVGRGRSQAIRALGWAGRFGVSGLGLVRVWGCWVGVGRTFVLAGMACVGWGR